MTVMPLDTTPWVSLAADPAVALGPARQLPGRRGPPLVDHLSEAALNGRGSPSRSVDHPPHECGAIPGAPGRSKKTYLRVVGGFGRRRSPVASIEAETHGTTSRRSSTSSSGGWRSAAPGAGRGPRCPPHRGTAHIFCERGHQQPLLRAHDPLGRSTSGSPRPVLAARRGGGARRGRDADMLARTHGQPATPVTLGKGSPSSHTGCAARSHGSRATRRSARSTARPARTAPTRSRFRAPTGKRSPGDHRARADLEPAHHADREPRLAERAVRRHRPVQPPPAQLCNRRVDLHLAPRLLRAEPQRSGLDRVLDDAAQGQPDPVRER